MGPQPRTQLPSPWTLYHIIDLSYIIPYACPPSSDPGPPPLYIRQGPASLLLTSGGHHYRPIQTYSLEVLVASEAYMVCKWVACIFLVSNAMKRSIWLYYPSISPGIGAKDVCCSMFFFGKKIEFLMVCKGLQFFYHHMM